MQENNKLKGFDAVYSCEDFTWSKDIEINRRPITLFRSPFLCGPDYGLSDVYPGPPKASGLPGMNYVSSRFLDLTEEIYPDVSRVIDDVVSDYKDYYGLISSFVKPSIFFKDYKEGQQYVKTEIVDGYVRTLFSEFPLPGFKPIPNYF